MNLTLLDPHIGHPCSLILAQILLNPHHTFSKRASTGGSLENRMTTTINHTNMHMTS